MARGTFGLFTTMGYVTSPVWAVALNMEKSTTRLTNTWTTMKLRSIPKDKEQTDFPQGKVKDNASFIFERYKGFFELG